MSQASGSSSRSSSGKLHTLFGIIGALSFLGGFVIAVVAGIWYEDHSGLALTLVIMGLAVGLFNITGKEVVPYLVAAIALVLVGQGDVFLRLDDVGNNLGTTLDDIVKQLAIFTAPAAVVNAIRAAVAFARPGES